MGFAFVPANRSQGGGIIVRPIRSMRAAPADDKDDFALGRSFLANSRPQWVGISSTTRPHQQVRRTLRTTCQRLSHCQYEILNGQVVSVNCNFRTMINRFTSENDLDAARKLINTDFAVAPAVTHAFARTMRRGAGRGRLMHLRHPRL